MTDLPPVKWKASPNFNSRRGTRVDQIIVHDMEGNYAGSVAWFEMPASQVSAHFCIREDGGEITQMVHLADRAWHACNANSRSVGLEMAGYASKGYSPALLATTTALVAWLCHYLQIPVKHARGGVGPGIESHWGLGKAGGGHSDPSTDPTWMDKFIAGVQIEYNKGYDPHWIDGDEGPKPCALTPPEGPSDDGRAALAASLNLKQIDGLKQALILLGFNLGPTGASGPMDAATENAVKAFQATRSLDVDGDAGPLTQSALAKALA